MVFGLLYPGYMSYKVLKTKRSTNYVCVYFFKYVAYSKNGFILIKYMVILQKFKIFKLFYST